MSRNLADGNVRLTTRPHVHVVAEPGIVDRWRTALLEAARGAVDVTVAVPESPLPDRCDLLFLDSLPCGIDGLPPSSVSDLIGSIAIGPLLSAPPGFVGPGMFGAGQGGLHSIFPFLQSGPLAAAWKARADGILGNIVELAGSVPADDGWPIPSLDPDSPLARVAAAATLFLRGIDWAGGPRVAGYQHPASHGEPPRIAIGPSTESGVSTFDIIGTNGTIRMRFDPPDATVELEVQGIPGRRTIWHGHLDPIRLGAAIAVRAVDQNPPRLMPVEPLLLFRDNLLSLNALLARRGAPDDTRDAAAGGFVANSFISVPDDGDGTMRELKVFVANRCNLNCPFCFSRTPDCAATGIDGFKAHFAAARAAGYNAVILSGGEPTLNPDLSAIVRAARGAGMESVGIETNAILAGRPGLAAGLAAAGVNRALVSFHSMDPDTLELMTGVRGQLPAVLAGLDALQECGIAVDVNCVTTIHNFRELPDIAAFFAARPRRIGQMVLSFMAGLGKALEHTELYPRMTEAAPYFDRAIAILLRAGIDPAIPGQCGLPQCILPQHADVFCNQQVARRVPGWHAPQLERKVFAPSCAECAARRWCHGIWTAYADTFGFDEFRPIPQE